MALPVKVQTASPVVVASNGSSIAPTLSGVVAGNTLILSVVNTTNTTGYAASAVSGGGATWYLVASEPKGSLGIVDIWVGTGGTGGSITVTATINGSTPVSGCNLDEWSGIAAVPFLESFVVNASTSTSPAAGAQVPTDVGDVLYVATLSANTQSGNPASPWSNLAGPTTGGAQKSGLAYFIATSGASQTATWTQSSGLWAAAGVILRVAQPPGYQIQNDPSAQNNAAVLTAQSSLDYVDSLITAAALQGTGVLSGCAVSPDTGSNLDFQVGGGTALVNGAPVTVTAATAQAITAADGANPRRDIVYVNYAGTITYKAGTANATPCPPTPPRMCPVLAIIDVPANATQCDATTSTSTAHVIDKRVLCAGTLAVLRPTAAAFETIPRQLTGQSAGNQVSGTLGLMPIALPAGLSVGHIVFINGAQNAVSPTHWWFGLYDSNRNQLALTADQTSSAWAANTLMSLAIATTASGAQSTFVTTYSGLHYLGFMMAAGTVVGLIANAPSSNITALAPVLEGTSSDTSQTTPPAFPHTAGALTGISRISYAYVSN